MGGNWTKQNKNRTADTKIHSCSGGGMNYQWFCYLPTYLLLVTLFGVSTGGVSHSDLFLPSTSICWTCYITQLPKVIRHGVMPSLSSSSCVGHVISHSYLKWHVMVSCQVCQVLRAFCSLVWCSFLPVKRLLNFITCKAVFDASCMYLNPNLSSAKPYGIWRVDRVYPTPTFPKSCTARHVYFTSLEKLRAERHI